MNFIQNGVYESVNYGYRENNTAVALWFYDACKDKYPVIFKIRIKPEDLYKLANQLVSENILNDALVFLKRNIQNFRITQNHLLQLPGFMKALMKVSNH